MVLNTVELCRTQVWTTVSSPTWGFFFFTEHVHNQWSAESKEAEPQIWSFFYFLGTIKQFSTVAVHSYKQMHKGSNLTTSLSTLVIFCFSSFFCFYSSHPNKLYFNHSVTGGKCTIQKTNFKNSFSNRCPSDLATLWGLRDLSFWTRDWTQTLGTESVEP